MFRSLFQDRHSQRSSRRTRRGHLVVEPLEGRQLLSTVPSFIVTNTNASGTNSLAWAIAQADAVTGGPSTIDFDIPGGGPYTINLDTPLPTITASVTIDGTSQPGYAGAPLVLLDGMNQAQGAGLSVAASNVTIEGLAIESFQGDGVYAGGGASQLTIADDVVSSNYGDGLDLQGDSSVTIAGDQILGDRYGVDANGVAGLTIGGSSPAARNVISGNDADGVYAVNSPGALVEGNAIGTDPSGQAVMGNLYAAGVELSGSSDAILRGNVIADNLIGVSIDGSTDDALQGNFIGTGGPGSPQGVDFANDQVGVQIIDGSTGTVIGGTDPAAANVISGSALAGIYIHGQGTGGAFIVGNEIGTDSKGAASVPNGYGVYIADGAAGSEIGSMAAYNVISGNRDGGILVQDASGNLVAGNFIGTTAHGAGALPNGGPGVEVLGESTGNTIGGPWCGVRDLNVLSGNQGDGVLLQSDSTGAPNGNTIQFNFIGTDATGAYAIPNSGNGVNVGGGSGDNDVDNDLISANGGAGVLLNGAYQSSVCDNWIGLNGAGDGALDAPGRWYSNTQGVWLTNGATSNWVGGNVISGNEVGVYLSGGATWNSVDYNQIGTGVDGQTPVGNAWWGVELDGVTGNAVGSDVIVNSDIGIYGVNGANQDNNALPGDTLAITVNGVTYGNYWYASLFE